MADKKPWNHIKPIVEETLEIDGVDTAAGLVRRGRKYAYKRDGKIRITDEGHALLGQQQRAAARRNEGKWRGVTGLHDERPPQPGV